MWCTVQWIWDEAEKWLVKLPKVWLSWTESWDNCLIPSRARPYATNWIGICPLQSGLEWTSIRNTDPTGPYQVILFDPALNVGSEDEFPLKMGYLQGQTVDLGDLMWTTASVHIPVIDDLLGSQTPAGLPLSISHPINRWTSLLNISREWQMCCGS